MAGGSGRSLPRRLLPLLTAVALLATGCAGSDRSSGSPPSSHTSHARSGRASFEPTPADFREIRALLARQARALTAHDQAAFLATIDSSQKGLVRQQTTLFDNIAELPVAALHYGVDTSAALVPASIPGHHPLLHPAVVEHLRLDGTFHGAVSNAVDETFVRRGGRWLLGAESEATERDHFDTPQERPWFGVPIVSSHVGDMTVLVDQSQADRLSTLTTAVRDDIGYDAQLLGVPASYRILVDATTNGLSFDFSSVSQEEAAAVTFPVVATDPLGDRTTGLAGLVIKVNPHTVDRVVGDAGIMRHELTHYLLHRYSGSPQWLTEGVASWVQYYPDDFAQWQIPADLYTRLMNAEHTLPIIGLFNDDPSLNYPISQAAVAWLVQTYGVPKLRRLMADYRTDYAGADVDALTPRLLRQVYAVTPAQVTDGAWRLLAQYVH